jgi:hypothetical protein
MDDNAAGTRTKARISAEEVARRREALRHAQANNRIEDIISRPRNRSYLRGLLPPSCLPPDPQVVGLYVAACASEPPAAGRKPISVRNIERRLSAIAWMCAQHGTPLDHADRHIMEVMKCHGLDRPRLQRGFEGTDDCGEHRRQ